MHATIAGAPTRANQPSNNPTYHVRMHKQLADVTGSQGQVPTSHRAPLFLSGAIHGTTRPPYRLRRACPPDPIPELSLICTRRFLPEGLLHVLLQDKPVANRRNFACLATTNAVISRVISDENGNIATGTPRTSDRVIASAGAQDVRFRMAGSGYWRYVTAYRTDMSVAHPDHCTIPAMRQELFLPAAESTKSCTGFIPWNMSTFDAAQSSLWRGTCQRYSLSPGCDIKVTRISYNVLKVSRNSFVYCHGRSVARDSNVIPFPLSPQCTPSST